MTAAQNATKIQQLLKAEIKTLTAERDALAEKLRAMTEQAAGYVLAEYRLTGEAANLRSDVLQAVARLRRMHHVINGSEDRYCHADNQLWPCPTIKALEGDAS